MPCLVRCHLLVMKHELGDGVQIAHGHGSLRVMRGAENWGLDEGGRRVALGFSGMCEDTGWSVPQQSSPC